MSLLEMEQQLKTASQWSFSMASSAYFLTLLCVGVVLLNLFVVNLAVLSLYLSRNQYESRAMIATQNLAQVLEHDIAAAIDKIDLALLTQIDEISRQAAGGGIDGQVLNAFVKQQLARQPDLESLHFANAQGSVDYGTRVESGAPANVGDQDYFTRLRDDPKVGLVIAEPLLERITGKWVLVLGRRVSGPDGSFAGVVCATISLDNFNRLFSTLNLGSHGAVSLRDTKLGLIARHAPGNSASAAVGSNSVSKQLNEMVQLKPVAGTYIAYTKMDGIERANAYRKISNYPFYIIVGLATDDFLADWHDEAVKTLTLVTAFLVVTLALSWLIYRSFKLRELLSRREVAIQEEERRRLAAELHDNTSPNLAALSLNLGMIAADLPPDLPAELDARFTDNRALLARITTGIRDVCGDLRPATLDYASLSHALREYAEQFSRRTGIAVEVSGPGSEQRLAPDIEFMLIRVAQEALTNCAKHAKASAINIELTQTGAHAVLTISDDGVGFDPKALGQSKRRPGLGLLSMRERVELAGGKFSIESQPGKGTRIRVEI